MTFDTQSVRSFLNDQLHLDAEDVISVGQGDWSVAYYFRVGDQHKVILFNTNDDNFKKNQAAQRYASETLPIPPIESLGKTEDGFYAISPRAPGVMIDTLDAAAMQKTLPQLLDLFNALRLIDLSDTKKYGGWDIQHVGSARSWHEYLSSVTDDSATSWMHWQEKLDARPDIHNVFTKVYDKMLSLLKYCPEEKHLVHNDLLHFNVLVEHNKITGVIDWANSLYGDFLYDPAMFVLWQFHYPAMDGINFTQEIRTYFEGKGVDLTNYEERMLCYQCHLALDAMKYCLYKNNDTDLDRITKRIQEII